MRPQLRIGKAAIGQEHPLDPGGQQRRDGIEPRLIRRMGDTAATLLHPLPHHWDGATPIHQREPHATILIPQHAGLQGQSARVRPPLGQGLLDQGARERRDLHPRIRQPPRKAALGTLRLPRPPIHEGHPRREIHAPRLYAAHHHPGQRLQMPHLAPLSGLTE